jgi:hypothetical protein
MLLVGLNRGPDRGSDRQGARELDETGTLKTPVISTRSPGRRVSTRPSKAKTLRVVGVSPWGISSGVSCTRMT